MKKMRKYCPEIEWRGSVVSWPAARAVTLKRTCPESQTLRRLFSSSPPGAFLARDSRTGALKRVGNQKKIHTASLLRTNLSHGSRGLFSVELRRGSFTVSSHRYAIVPPACKWCETGGICFFSRCAFPSSFFSFPPTSPKANGKHDGFNRPSYAREQSNCHDFFPMGNSYFFPRCFWL